MGKLAGLGIGIITTLLGILWFYGIMYNWLWLGLMNSSSTGWIIGFGILFVIFLFLTIVVVVLLGLGYIGAIIVGCDV